MITRFDVTTDLRENMTVTVEFMIPRELMHVALGMPGSERHVAENLLRAYVANLDANRVELPMPPPTPANVEEKPTFYKKRRINIESLSDIDTEAE